MCKWCDLAINASTQKLNTLPAAEAVAAVCLLQTTYLQVSASQAHGPHLCHDHDLLVVLLHQLVHRLVVQPARRGVVPASMRASAACLS